MKTFLFSNVQSKDTRRIMKRTVIYRIKRNDGEEDKVTSHQFRNYDDAYDMLEDIYSDMCCSDADYEDRPYYEILEIQE